MPNNASIDSITPAIRLPPMKLNIAGIRLKAVDTTTISGTNLASVFKILIILITNLIWLSVEDDDDEEDNTKYLWYYVLTNIRRFKKEKVLLIS